MVELLDRDAALGVLHDALARARAGAGQVVVVAGEPGIGKTVLVRRFLDGLDQDVRVLEGACDDLLTPRPLGPFHDVARRLGGEFAALLDGGAGRDRVHLALFDSLSRLPPPPVLVLEDLHWADEATLDVVAMLGRRVEEHALLLVTTHRAQEVGADHPLTRVLASLPASVRTTVGLDPLSPAAVARLVGDRDVDVARLHDLTGGNPFYVTEVLATEGLGLPPSVGLAVMARLGQLPTEAQELLRVVALVPGRVGTDLLDLLDPTWPMVLEPADAAGVVDLRGTTLAFRHELARQAVVASTPRLFARRHHARILQALEELGADPAALVHHAEGAGDLPAVARYARLAAGAAHRAESHREAVAHYERALAAAEDELPVEVAAELSYGLGRARMAADAAEHDAVAAAARAVELLRTVDDARGLGRALASLARIASWAGDNRSADRIATEAVELLDDGTSTAELADALLSAAYVRLAFWDFSAAARLADRALGVSTASDAPAEAALARTYLGVVRIARTGDATLFEQGLSACQHAGNRLGIIDGFSTGSTALAFRGDHAPALDLLGRGIAFADDNEYASWGGYMRTVRAQVLAETGRWDDATAEIEGTVAAMRSQAWPRASALVVRGRLRARRGDPGARDDLTRAWALARDFAVTQLRHAAAAGLAELAWLEGRLDDVPPELAEVVRDDAGLTPAARGELGMWLQRAGADAGDPAAMSQPYRALVEGRHAEAVEAWTGRGRVYEAAEAAVLADDVELVREGLARLDGLGAQPLARRARARLRDLGAAAPRGPVRTTRAHPAGLTQRQAEVLEFLVAGATNAEIADHLVVSVRTVDHHVSAVLQKLGVATRQEAAAAARTLGGEPIS